VFSWNDIRLSFNTSGNGACVVPGAFPFVPTIDLNNEQIDDGNDKLIWTPSVFISNVEHEEAGMKKRA
jgi:hypothetical protein